MLGLLSRMSGAAQVGTKTDLRFWSERIFIHRKHTNSPWLHSSSYGHLIIQFLRNIQPFFWFIMWFMLTYRDLWLTITPVFKSMLLDK